MVYRTFEELIETRKTAAKVARMAVAAAGDEHTIEAVLDAREKGIVSPILVGDKALIDAALAKFGATVPAADIYDVPDIAEAAKFAVSLVREGRANLLMKGKLDTSVMLRPVVNKETGLGKGGVMSHFTAFEVPSYHKLLVPVDGGMVTYPTLEQKRPSSRTPWALCGPWATTRSRWACWPAWKRSTPRCPRPWRPTR